MTNRNLQNAIRGSLVGGAAGDALGYAIEFKRENEIFRLYGENGITEYALSGSGKALISDDTQMTLFTAEGLLWARTGGSARPRHAIADAYQNWLLTQNDTYEHVKTLPLDAPSRLLTEPEIFALRAPGNTCLSALYHASHAPAYPDDYIASPCNDSKGCGGVMRVAPVALDPVLRRRMTEDEIALEAAQAAAITHGHSLGYMPAALLCLIIGRIVFPDGERKALKEIVRESTETVGRLFWGDPHLDTLTRLMDLATELSENGQSDLDNIHRLGEGWIAEEALAIAVYCALRYPNDFSKCLIASVNHKGDSDSTGAIAGNILGALVGFDAIDERWKNRLELKDLILEIADALCDDDPA